jgi:hypothetical protein
MNFMTGVWHECCFIYYQTTYYQRVFKGDFMRNLLLSILVLASLVSCGKDKGANVLTGASNNAINIADATGVQLGGLIDTSETSFGFAQIGTGNWNQAVAFYPYYSFKYVTTSEASNSNCVQHGGFFKFYTCTYTSGSTSTNVTFSRVVPASSIVLAAKRAELKAIINSAIVPYGIQTLGSRYIIRTTIGVIYTIDTSYPIQANPVSVTQTNGQQEYFYNFAQ